MKKYIITEEQLKVILEKADETPGEFAKTPNMSFDQLLQTIEKGGDGKRDVNKDDTKSFVTGTVAANRAEYNLDKTDASLKAIAGKFYKSITGYGINPDDSVLAQAEDLAIIIMSMAYYYYKEGKISRFNVTDVDLNFRKNYNELKRTNLGDIRGLLRTKFDGDLGGYPDNDDEDIVMISPKNSNPSFQAYISKSTKRTTMVRFNFFDSSSLRFFYEDFLKNQKNIDLISKAINRRVRPKIEGDSLIFLF